MVNADIAYCFKTNKAKSALTIKLDCLATDLLSSHLYGGMLWWYGDCVVCAYGDRDGNHEFKM